MIEESGRIARALAVSVPLLFVGAIGVLVVLGGSPSCGGGSAIYADAASEAGSTCPLSVAGLKTPTWKAPKTGTVGACSPAELDILQQTSANPDRSFTDLYNAMTSDTCRACVFSTETDSTWQPIVWSPSMASGSAFLNFGACFAFVSGGSAACGKAVQDNQFCFDAACPDICADRTTCLNVAGLDTCAPQGTVVRSACGPASGAIFKTCDTFIDGLRAVCGPVIVDAGTDAGDASTTDASDSGTTDASDASDAADQ